MHLQHNPHNFIDFLAICAAVRCFRLKARFALALSLSLPVHAIEFSFSDARTGPGLP